MLSQNIPTDNLYKFMSVFGLVVLISSATFKYFAITEIQKSVAILMVSIAEVQVQSQAILRDAEKATLKKVEFKNKADQIKIQIEIAKAKANSAKEKIAMFNDFNTKANYMFIFGFVLSVPGFFLWYIKLQQYLDREIKRKSKK